MQFILDNQYFTSVNIRTVIYKRKRTNETEEDFIIRKLSTDNAPMYMYESKDHPEFAKLREQLRELKYIKIESGWWNGDRVLRKFQLNNKVFKKGDKFMCASAMAYEMK